jgi:3-hydroxy acid dehydrogenase / malonic semialdehyde reductase
MTQLRDRIVFITGASSGIGRAAALGFAREGAKLLLAARRLERLEDLAASLSQASNVATHFLALDVRDRTAVEAAVAGLPPEWSEIDVLVNNAGLSRGLDKLHEGDHQDWDEMIDTNVKGLLYVTRAVVPGMVRRGAGHVINIGSIAGREVYPGGNVYCASKFAERAISKGLMIDLNGTPVRVTTIDPGMVETEFSLVRFHGDSARAAKVYQGVKPLTAEDVADAVIYCATRPLHVNVAEMVLLPTAQAAATVVHRTT